MPDEQKNFGDEVFIYQMSLKNSSQQEQHKNNILDGYIILNEEKIMLKKMKILGGRVSIIIPEVFKLMTKEIADMKYPSINRPDTIYTNTEANINLTVSHKDGPISDEDIPEAKDLIQQSVKRMFPNMLDSGSMKAGGKNIAYFDYISAALDTDIYNLMFFFSLDERIVISSFNCPNNDMNDWKPIFMQMIKSIEII